MTPLSTREALGGRWAWDVSGWAMMLLPGGLVVAVQETSFLHLSFGRLVVIILISSAAQSLAAGLVTAAIATIARRYWPIIPLGVVISMWLVIGIVRGLTGGAVAEIVTGDNPLFAQRIVAWAIVSLIWIPLFVYTAAQIEHRRCLLAELTTVRLASDLEDAQLRLSAAELRNSIAVIVRSRMRPVLDEIQRSLKSVAGQSDITALREIGERLSMVWRDAAVMLDPTRPLTEQRRDALTSRPARSSIAAALAIELRRPARTALLSALALVPTIIPLGLRAVDLDTAWHTLLALAVIGAVLYFSAALRRRTAPTPTPLQFAAAILGYLAAGLCGSVTIAALDVSGPSRLALVTLWLLPIATVVSASCVTAAVGIGSANRDLFTIVVDEQERVARDRHRSEILEATVREQLALLMHGPVQGRLAACVMALNFHLNSSEGLDPRRTAIVTSAVIEHLAAALRDLDDLPALAAAGGATRLD